MKNSSPIKITNHEKPIPRWQHERAARLQRICESIEGRIARGQKLRKAIGWFRWYYQNRTYRCDPTRRFRICRGTLIRQFYHWRNNGKTVDTFRLHHRSGKEKLDRGLVIKFLRACLRPGVRSYRAAYTGMKNPPTAVDAYFHAMPKKCRQALARLFSQRRHAEWEERRARRVVEEFSN